MSNYNRSGLPPGYYDDSKHALPAKMQWII